MGLGRTIADAQPALVDLDIDQASERLHHHARRLVKVSIVQVRVAHFRVGRRGQLVISRPEERVGQTEVKLVRVGGIRVALDILAIERGGLSILVGRLIADRLRVLLLNALLTTALRGLMHLNRRADDRDLAQPLGFSEFDRAIHICGLPRAPGAKAREGRDRLEFAIELREVAVRGGDPIRIAGHEMVQRPPLEGVLPDLDRLLVAGVFIEEVTGGEIDVRRPFAILRQEARVLKPLE